MPAWLNQVTIAAPRNGTTSHTVTPSSGTGVVSGTAFTPTAGRFLLCVAAGSVTSTTPTGWTLPTNGSAINNTGLYVWYKASAAGGDTLTTTHNGSNYPVGFAVFEFPAGTTFVKAISAISASTTAANPNLTGLTGTNTVMGFAGWGAITTLSAAATWSSPNVEVVDTGVVTASGTDGFWLGGAYQDGYTSTSYQPTPTISNVPATSSERLTFAVNVVTITTVTLTPVVETDGAQALSWTRFRALTPVVESDAAQALAFVRFRSLAPVTSANAAQALAFTRFKTLTPVVETDSAVALSVTHGTLDPIGPAFAASTQQTNRYFLGINQQYQRKTFTAGGLRWIFYATSGSTDGDPTWAEFVTSPDGETWSSPTFLMDLDSGNGGYGARYFEVHFDGTYLHYVRGGSTFGVGVSYRRGLPESDGTITWSAGEQTVISGLDIQLELSVTTDASGHPFVSWEDYRDANRTDAPIPRVAWSTTTDGTWSHGSGSPRALSTVTNDWWTGLLRLNSGKVAVLYWSYDQAYAQVWSGSAWGSEETIISSAGGAWVDSEQGNFATACDPTSGTAFFLSGNDDSAPTAIRLSVRDPTAGTWSTANLSSGIPGETIAATFADDGLLHVFSTDANDLLTAEVIHETRSLGGSWSTLDPLDFSAFGRPRTSALVVSQPGDGELVVATQVPDDFGVIGDGSDLILSMVLPLGAVPTSVTLTPAVEADSARPLSFTRFKSLTPVTDVAAAVALSWTRLRALTSVSEVDSAVALSSLRAATLTPASDTASAVAISRLRVATVTPALEADSSIALTAVKSVTLTPAGDVAGAQPITFVRVASLVPAGDVSSAQPITATKFATLTAAVEVDSATAVSFSQGSSITLAPVVEVDAAQALTARKFVTLTPVAEVDAAVAVSFTHGSGSFFTLTPAAGADAAQALSWTRFRALVPVTESDSAPAVSAFRSVTLTAAVSANGAVAIAYRRFVTLTPALEVDVAVPLVVSGPTFRSLTPATDASVAAPLAWVRFRALTAAIEVDSAMPITLGAGGLPQTRRALAGRIGRAAGGDALRAQPGRILRGITGRIR